MPIPRTIVNVVSICKGKCISGKDRQKRVRIIACDSESAVIANGSDNFVTTDLKIGSAARKSKTLKRASRLIRDRIAGRSIVLSDVSAASALPYPDGATIRGKLRLCRESAVNYPA